MLPGSVRDRLPRRLPVSLPVAQPGSLPVSLSGAACHMKSMTLRGILTATA